MNRKSGILLFLCACIPGCGQMYQGYMKRGVSLLGICCAIIGVASFLNIGELAILLPVIWVYAFFDSYNLRNQPEDDMQSDEYLFGLSELDSQRLSALCMRRHSIIGWVLVGLGIYVFYNTVIDQLMDLLVNYWDGFWWIRSLVMYTLPRAVVTILIICLGIWFIRGPRNKEDEEDYSFIPPEQSETQQSADPVGEPAGPTAITLTQDSHKEANQDE